MHDTYKSNFGLKSILRNVAVVIIFACLLFAPAFARTVQAQIPIGCPGATEQGPPAPGTDCEAGTVTPPGSIEQPKFTKSDCKGDIKAGVPEGSEGHCGILDYLVLFIQVLSAAVLIVCIGALIVAGIQYSASADDPNAVGAAKKRIINVVIALVAYAFMFSFLQYIVPGGVL